MTRPMTPDDAAWAAALMAQRRIEYEQYSPVLWKPAVGIEPMHAQFFAAVAADPNVICLRTDTGFAIATQTGTHHYVDDFAVEDGDWDITGAALLAACWTEASTRGSQFLRVVTARLDKPKAKMLHTNGFDLVEQWWVREISDADTKLPATEGGFEIQLTHAPPVYDPGGPVGVLAKFEPMFLDMAIGTAAANQAAVLVAPAIAADPREQALEAAGFEVASQFCIGEPDTPSIT